MPELNLMPAPAHHRHRGAFAPQTLRLHALSAAIATALFAFAPHGSAQEAMGAEPIDGDTEAEVTTAEPQPIPVREIRTFTEVFAKIKQDYVEEVDDRKLLEDAIRGMLTGLDPHSTYLDEKEYAGLQEGTTGEFGGLGLEVGSEDGMIKVISPIDGTPAAEAGIEAGDIIIRIDETPVRDMTLNDAVKRMRGKPGSEIKLTITREGAAAPLEFVLKRAVVQVTSVRGRLLEPGFGYIRVANFQGRTGQDARKQLLELRREADGELKGLILDLRNNPGGVLGAAVDISDMFLTSGLIVYTEGRVEDSQMSFSAEPQDLLNGQPLVVMVNEGSASASEIVAGALQDQKRAVIVGRQTFGKGSVQTILPMNDERAVKLTTARYFTPSGRSIQAEGVSPDIPIDRLNVAGVEKAALETVKEANLAGHLENASENGNVEGGADAETAPVSERETLAVQDYELYEALNLLKGMALFQSRRP